MDELPMDEDSAADDGGTTAQAARAMRDFSAEAAAEFTQAASKATRQLRASASALADEAREQFQGYLQAQMNAGVDLADEAILTARAFADELDEKAPHMADFVRAAAGQAEKASVHARELSPVDLYSAAADFAKRRPGIFIGAAAGLGFVLARFLKASAPGEPPLSAASAPDDPNDA